MTAVLALLLPACSGDLDTGAAPAPAASLEDLVWSCPDPAEAVAYTDVGAAWGLIDSTDDEPWPTWGSPVGLIDVDGDRDDDALIAPRGQGLWLHKNDGGAFSAERLLDDAQISSFAAGDVDGDRDLDLWVGTIGQAMYLLENDGSGGFTDVTAASGLDDLFALSEKTGASFADLDSDGDLDLFIAQNGSGQTQPEHQQILLRNEGDGTFQDISAQLDERHRSGVTWLGVWSDLDRDGDPDLYLANDLHESVGPSYLLRNDGGALEDVSDDCYCANGASAMGASTGDYDGDGQVDLFISATGYSDLYRNVDGLSFVETAAAVGAQIYVDIPPDEEQIWQMSMGSTFIDYDNDGWLDLMAIGGRLGIDDEQIQWQDPESPDRLLRWLPEEARFEDVAGALGVDALEDGRGVAYGIVNGDGYPDLLVGQIGAPSLLYLSTCAAETSLAVELVGRESEAYGVGARVELTLGDRVLVREVQTVNGLGATNHPRAWFGLGGDAPSALRIYWPSGAVQDVTLEPDASGLIFIDEADAL